MLVVGSVIWYMEEFHKCYCDVFLLSYYINNLNDNLNIIFTFYCNEFNLSKYTELSYKAMSHCKRKPILDV